MDNSKEGIRLRVLEVLSDPVFDVLQYLLVVYVVVELCDTASPLPMSPSTLAK